MPLQNVSFKEKSWRLSPMYLLYFTLFGVFVPYIARFLTMNGLTEQEASLIVAVVNGVNVFAPFLFSVLADRSGRRMRYIRIGYLGLGIFYSLSLFAQGFWFYLFIFSMFGIFLSAVLPQMEAVTLAVLGNEKKRYGQIRLWGSIGFVGIVWILGFLLDRFPVSILPITGSVLSVAMFFSTFLIKEQPKPIKNLSKNQIDIKVDSQIDSQVEMKSQEPVNEIVDGIVGKGPNSNSHQINWLQVVVLLTVILFWQFGMAPYNTFFDLYLRGHGFSATTIGFLISFGALCEIGIFFYISNFFKKYSERLLLSVALIITFIRWLLLYKYPEVFSIVLFSQSLHAFTFGVVHSVAIHRIGHLFPAHKASFGQGLYAAVGTGFGLFIGNILAGWLWNGSGVVYLQGAGWTFLALLITWFGFKEPKPNNAVEKVQSN